MFTAQTILAVASPATLASLIADIGQSWEPTTDELQLRESARRILANNVGNTEAAQMVAAAERSTVRPVGPEPKKLREALKQVSDRDFGRLRELFYRIADSAKPLADLLERVDADQAGDKDGAPLLAEHFVFAEVVEVLKGSKLGGVL